MLDIEALQRVMTIHDAGSVSKAASRLGMTQASLSKHLARLEHELGVRLFERTPNGSALTPAGQLTVEHARRLVEEAQSLERDVALLAGGAPQELSIGAAIALSSEFLPNLAPRVADRFPRVRMKFQIASAQQLLDRLKSRRLDIVFAGLPPLADEAGLDVVPLFTAPTVVVARPGHPLTHVRSIKPEDLRGHRFSGLFPHIAKGLGLTEDADWMSFYDSEQFVTLGTLAETGHAVVLAPEFAVRAQLEAGRLVKLDCDWTHDIAYSAVTNKGVATTKVIRGTIAAAKDCAAGL